MDASRLSDFLGDDGGEYPPAFAGVTLFRLDQHDFRKGIFTINHLKSITKGKSGAEKLFDETNQIFSGNPSNRYLQMITFMKLIDL